MGTPLIVDDDAHEDLHPLDLGSTFILGDRGLGVGRLRSAWTTIGSSRRTARSCRPTSGRGRGRRPVPNLPEPPSAAGSRC